METNRAYRRHQTEKVKAKRRKSYWGYWSSNDVEPMSPRTAGLLTNTAAPCSCHMCGNPRKWFKEKTLHEVVQLIELKEGCARLTAETL